VWSFVLYLPLSLFRAPAAWAYHTIGCFEEQVDGQTRLTLDINAHRTAEVTNGEFGYAYLENMRDPEKRKKQVRKH